MSSVYIIHKRKWCLSVSEDRPISGLYVCMCVYTPKLHRALFNVFVFFCLKQEPYSNNISPAALSIHVNLCSDDTDSNLELHRIVSLGFRFCIKVSSVFVSEYCFTGSTLSRKLRHLARSSSSFTLQFIESTHTHTQTSTLIQTSSHVHCV